LTNSGFLGGEERKVPKRSPSLFEQLDNICVGPFQSPQKSSRNAGCKKMNCKSFAIPNEEEKDNVLDIFEFYQKPESSQKPEKITALNSSSFSNKAKKEEKSNEKKWDPYQVYF